MVHFNDPWFEFLIDEHIKAKDLETHRVFNVVRLTRAVGMGQHRLHCAETLDDYRLDIVQNLLAIVTALIDVFHCERHRSFVASIVFFTSDVFLKFVTEFIDGVVRQMHEQVGQVRLGRGFVFLGGQTAEPFIVKVDAKRVNPTKQDVNAQVKFELVN